MFASLPESLARYSRPPNPTGSEIYLWESAVVESYGNEFAEGYQTPLRLLIR